MSRGPGKWQRAILDGVQRLLLARLRGSDCSGSTAIQQAARAIQRAGLCVIVRLWVAGGAL